MDDFRFQLKRLTKAVKEQNQLGGAIHLQVVLDESQELLEKTEPQKREEIDWGDGAGCLGDPNE